jgi:hypothetical protein
MKNIHFLLIIFTPFFLLFYLAIGWGFTSSLYNSNLKKLNIRNKIAGFIIFFPVYYFISSFKNLFKKSN